MGASGSGSERASRPGRRLLRRAPLATQIEEILVQRLRSGELTPGDQLPSEHELASELGVSRATIRLAIGALARRGLVTSRHGVGSFVSEGSRIANSLTDAIDFHQLIGDGDADPGVVFDEAAVVPASEREAAALGLDPASPVHRAAKRFTASGTVVIYAVTAIPVSLLGAGLVAAVEVDPTITEPLFAFVDDRLGLRTEYQLTSLRALRGEEVSYPGHGLAAGDAILELDETGYTVDNRPVWHSLNWYPPGAMRFELVRQRPWGPL